MCSLLKLTASKKWDNTDQEVFKLDVRDIFKKLQIIPQIPQFASSLEKKHVSTTQSIPAASQMLKIIRTQVCAKTTGQIYSLFFEWNTFEKRINQLRGFGNKMWTKGVVFGCCELFPRGKKCISIKPTFWKKTALINICNTRALEKILSDLICPKLDSPKLHRSEV